jgi:3-isopropylmalate/(R)-2-methylmalate dehydratase large subunit
MGKNMYEKIIEPHILQVLPDGSLVLELDRVWGHEITLPPGIIDAKARGCDVVFDPNKIKTMIDHVNPAKDTASAIQGQIIREWSKEHNIEFLDVGRNGVCHAIIPESGWVRPGEIGIMGDSHTCTHGAFGTFSAGVGTTELEIGIITGMWTCPKQEVIRVNFVGKLPANVFAKDIVLSLIGQIGVKGATNAVIEFGGPVIENMTMESRMTITNMVVEAGATSGIMPIDEKTLNYLRPAVAKSNGEHDIDNILKEFLSFNSDVDAEYDEFMEIDLSTMTPISTINYSPGDVVKVSRLSGKKVDQVYIGSCTNGRIEDLRIAASIIALEGGKISDSVRCVVVPATQHIYKMALSEGLIKIFTEAGCFVSGPTCGACLGMSCGVLAPGEVCVSTTNRNFPGRMGKEGMVHLVSPATAAMTAIYGVIREASEKTCEQIQDHFLMVGETSQSVPTSWNDVEFETPDYTSLLDVVSGKSETDFSGSVFYLLDDNVDTDQIIPAKYLTETKKEVFGEHCLEDAAISKEGRLKLFSSKILVAGDNFGCGSSREHAPWALEEAGIKCVIAPSFARIFQNNMFANGLLCVTLDKEKIDRLFDDRPDNLTINVEDGSVEWANGHLDFELFDYQRNLIKNGGSVAVMIKMASDLQKQGKLV